MRHEDVLHDLFAAGAGEGDEPVAVHVPVRVGDQRLVVAAVVPVQVPREIDDGRDDVEEAFETRRISVVIAFVGSSREERRRRQLSAIAGDDALTAAQERGHGVFGEDLAGLVEDDGVEVLPVARKQLAD